MPCSARSISAWQIGSTSNATAYAGTAFTPLPNKLYLMAVLESDAAPETTDPTFTTTGGLTFVQVGTSVVFDTIASNVHRLSVWRALKPTSTALSSASLTANFADAGTGCCVIVIEINEVNQGGSDGASAVVQSAGNAGDASANPNATLGAFASAANATIVFAGSDIQTAPTADAGWVELGTNPDYNTPATGLACFFRSDNDTTATCTLTASDWGAIAVEISYAHNTEALKWSAPIIADRVPAKCEVVAYGHLPGLVLG